MKTNIIIAAIVAASLALLPNAANAQNARAQPPSKVQSHAPAGKDSEAGKPAPHKMQKGEKPGPGRQHGKQHAERAHNKRTHCHKDCCRLERPKPMPHHPQPKCHHGKHHDRPVPPPPAPRRDSHEGVIHVSLPGLTIIVGA
ncbi:MAG: hypothetical protein MR215_03120 [Bacteroidales bacterium]|nr:hypothetical protein [Bacteroidales bacterium]MDY4173939.1 hypothetical protein [Bacteroidales bacterium]